MAESRGSKYEKDGIWWVRFQLPPGQTWTDPQRPDKPQSHIETSVRKWFKPQGIDGKGKVGKQWADRLLALLNERYYSGAPLTPMDQRTRVRDLVTNVVAEYNRKGMASEEGAVHAMGIFERHGIAGLTAAEVTTQRMEQYRADRMKLDGVKSSTVNRDFALLHYAFNLGMRNTPPLVTAVPRFPRGKDCARRQGYMTLPLYDEFIRGVRADVRPFFVAGCYLGVRVGALLAMRWSWIELFPSPQNDVHGVIRIPKEVMKNNEGLTTVIFGELGVELARLKAIRDLHFPKQERVFMRWEERAGGGGPVVDAARRTAYAEHVTACVEGRMTAVAAAEALGITPRYMGMLVRRFMLGGGRAALAQGRLSEGGAATETLVDQATPLSYSFARLRWKQGVANLGRPELIMHDMRRTALDLFRRAGFTKEQCMRWLGHKTDSMFRWYSIDPNESDIVEQGAQVAASLRTRRLHAVA